jgi:hypothetical protein
VHDEDLEFEEYPAELNVQDFDAVVRFFNPYSTTRGSWDYGFTFRRLEQGTFYTVLINSSGQWSYGLRHLDEPLEQSPSDAIDTSEGGSNLLKLTVRGNTGSFYINNQLVNILDLSFLIQPGDVSIVTGYFTGDELPGEATPFMGFAVWRK